MKLRRIVSRSAGRFLVRLRMPFGVRPLSSRWGERGRLVHRHYLEQFLQAHAADIRGRCLEFQEDSYTTRFARSAVARLDIINRDEGHPGTTILADLTAANDVPSDSFDCIICTYVLHLVFEKERMLSELYRILRPGGILLVCVPDITIDYPRYAEYWRFTRDGLRGMLARHFSDGDILIEAYGNSLVAAGELRGLALADFSPSELDQRDPRYSLVICARAVKGVPAAVLSAPPNGGAGRP